MAKKKDKAFEEERAIKRWYSLKTKCYKNKIPFNLTVEQIKKLYKVKHCIVSGEKLVVPTSATQTDDTLTFDRLIPEKGYVNGNVVVMSRRINGGKSNLTYLEIIKLAKFIKKVNRMSSKSDNEAIKLLSKKK